MLHLFIPFAVGVLGKCAGVSCGVGISAAKAAAIAGASLGTAAAAGAAASTRKNNSEHNCAERIQLLKDLLESGKISEEEYNILKD